MFHEMFGQNIKNVHKLQELGIVLHMRTNRMLQLLWGLSAGIYSDRFLLCVISVADVSTSLTLQRLFPPLLYSDELGL